MSKAATTLEVDRDAREIFNTAAIAIGTHDTEAAFDVCRRLIVLEPHYRFALRVGNDAPPEYRDKDVQNSAQSGASSRASSLRHIEAKFAGRCAKCAQGFGVGASIAYDPTSKRAFHERCAR